MIVDTMGIADVIVYSDSLALTQVGDEQNAKALHACQCDCKLVLWYSHPTREKFREGHGR